MRGSYTQQPYHSPRDGSDSIVNCFVPAPLTDFNESVDLTLAGRLAEVELELSRATARVPAALAALLEARASARIENHDVALDWHLTQRRRPRHTWGLNTEANEGNLALVEAALTCAAEATERPLSRQLLHAWHGALFHGIEFNRRDWIGAARTRMVWISNGFGGPTTALYVAPPAAEVDRLLDDLAAFEQRRVLSPLVAALVDYAQFETIHPYADGNGRTGRALIQYALGVRDYADRAALVAPTLCSRQSDHIGLLVAWREGDSEFFWELVVELGQQMADSTNALALQIDRLQQQWRQQLDACAAHDSVRRLAHSLLVDPVVSVADAADRLGMSRPAGKRAIDGLVEAGVLVAHEPERKRDRLWRADQLIGVLDDWEGRHARPPYSYMF